MKTYRLTAVLLATVLSVAPLSFADRATADETCLSPYMAGLIKGQEKYLAGLDTRRQRHGRRER